MNEKNINLNGSASKANYTNKKETIKIFDLFAGIGGMRRGFEEACNNVGYQTECVMTSEIKPHARLVLSSNYPDEIISGDITQIEAHTIPDFDFLLAGFPCQAFSYAGKRLGFQDTRGTLFFEIERILKEKRPFGFILENVEGLVTHDKVNKNSLIGRTLETILSRLHEIGYYVSWEILNSHNFGVPQNRSRVYIVGTRSNVVSLSNFNKKHTTLASILEKGLPIVNSDFTDRLMTHYTPKELYGKSIKDKRGGPNNIHSWEIGLKGEVSPEQRDLLNMIMTERRKKKWAEQHQIKWMDGMPLTESMIREFYNHKHLNQMLEDLVKKGYLKKEYPKQLIKETTLLGERYVRKQDTKKQIGYNIVTGKLSFEVNKILDPDDIAPTLVATDMHKLFVVDGKGIRPLSLREGLRLFGFPNSFKFPVTTTEGYDLLGNTVVVPVISAIATRLIEPFIQYITKEGKPIYYEQSDSAIPYASR